MESWVIIFLSVVIMVSTIVNQVTLRKKLDEAYKRGLSDATVKAKSK